MPYTEYQEFMSSNPLLLFDSGVGGLSVLSHIRHAIPDSSIVYCADNAGFPYGLKTEAWLAERVPRILQSLVARYNPCAIVIPCNTASTIALDAVRAVITLPVVGTVPAIKPAAEQTRTGVIAVLGTLATVRQKYVDDLINQFASHCTVLRHGSAELVELAERKLRGDDAPVEDYAAALAGLLSQPHADKIDTIVLACTHFPLIEQELAAALDRPINWVDSGAGIARRTQHVTKNIQWPMPATGRAVFTSKADNIALLKPALAACGLSSIEYL